MSTKRSHEIVLADILKPRQIAALDAFAKLYSKSSKVTKTVLQRHVIHPIAAGAVAELGVQPATACGGVFPRLGELIKEKIPRDHVVGGASLDYGMMVKTRAGEFKRGGSKGKEMEVEMTEGEFTASSPLLALRSAGKVRRRSPGVAPPPRAKKGMGTPAAVVQPVSDADQPDDGDEPLHNDLFTDGDSEEDAPLLNRRASGSAAHTVTSSGTHDPPASNAYADDSSDSEGAHKPPPRKTPARKTPASKPTVRAASTPVVTDAQAKLEVTEDRTRTKPAFGPGLRNSDICVLREAFPLDAVRNEDVVGWRTVITHVTGKVLPAKKAADKKEWVCAHVCIDCAAASHLACLAHVLWQVKVYGQWVDYEKAAILGIDTASEQDDDDDNDDDDDDDDDEPAD